MFRKQSVLRLIWKEGDEAEADGPARLKLREEVLVESASFVKTYSANGSVWTLRAAAALEIKRPREAWEAGQKMIELGLDKNENTLSQGILARLERLKWLGDQPPIDGPALVPAVPATAATPAPTTKPDFAAEMEKRLVLSELQQIIKELAVPSNAARVDEIRQQFLEKSANYLKQDTENLRVWTLRGLVLVDVPEKAKKDREQKGEIAKLEYASNEVVGKRMFEEASALSDVENSARARASGVGTKVFSMIKSGQPDPKAEEFIALLRRKDIYYDAMEQPSTTDTKADTSFPSLEAIGEIKPIGRLRELAENGDVNAMVQLGYAYENEIGIPQDHKEADKWYRNASAKGNKEALIRLAQMYDDYSIYHGEKSSEVEALFRQLAANGDAKAAYWLGDFLRACIGNLL